MGGNKIDGVPDCLSLDRELGPTEVPSMNITNFMTRGLYLCIEGSLVTADIMIDSTKITINADLVIPIAKISLIYK